MTSVDDFYPSKYLKADDLAGRDHTLTIARWETELMEDKSGHKQNRPIIYFEGKQKGLVLNKTNAGTIAGIYGKDLNQWPGKQITIGGVWVEAFGEQTLAIRVRPMLPQAAPQAPPAQANESNYDDEIPF